MTQFTGIEKRGFFSRQTFVMRNDSLHDSTVISQYKYKLRMIPGETPGVWYFIILFSTFFSTESVKASRDIFSLSVDSEAVAGSWSSSGSSAVPSSHFAARGVCASSSTGSPPSTPVCCVELAAHGKEARNKNE